MNKNTDKNIQGINQVINIACGFTTEIKFYESWDMLINVWNIFKGMNRQTFYSEHSHHNTAFLLGVTNNDISRSFFALGAILNDKSVHHRRMVLNEFATGNYMNKCGRCKTSFIGDKMAVRCPKCAIEIFRDGCILASKDEAFFEKKEFYTTTELKNLEPNENNTANNPEQQV